MNKEEESLNWVTKELWDLVELGLQYKVDEVTKTDAVISLEKEKGYETISAMSMDKIARLLFNVIIELEAAKKRLKDTGFVVMMGNKKYGWKPPD